jgi:ribonuclease T
MNAPLKQKQVAISDRFRGYLPVVVDVETGGFDPNKDALLEISAITLNISDDKWIPNEAITRYITPFEGANLDPAALDFTGIDPFHPFRREISVHEKVALQDVFRMVRSHMKEHGCKRAILVGHNAAFDISFLNAAVIRNNIKRNPFHPFSTFDTVTLAGLAYGQTVLSRAIEAAGIPWDSTQAHSAKYDAEKTAELFCTVVNRWHIGQ